MSIYVIIIEIKTIGGRKNAEVLIRTVKVSVRRNFRRDHKRNVLVAVFLLPIFLLNFVDKIKQMFYN